MKKMETVSIEMDSALYEDMKELCRELGMDAETAFTMFAQKMCREGHIPFEVEEDDCDWKKDPIYQEENARRILEAVDRLDRGYGVYHDLIEEE